MGHTHKLREEKHSGTRRDAVFYYSVDATLPGIVSGIAV